MYKKYLSFIILTPLILIIFGSALWKEGGIVLLDFILTPHAVSLWSGQWIYPVLDFLSASIGYEIVSKGFFLLVLFLAAYLGILFARKIFSLSLGNSYDDFEQNSGMLILLEIVGGVFFLMNPFAYERMMVQPTIYMGIILLGYMLYFLLFSSGKKKWLFIGIMGGLAFAFTLHVSYMIFFIFLLYAVFFIRSKREMLGLMIAGCIILLINANWIFASAFSGGHGGSVGQITNFDTANLEAFRTQALAPLDVWLTNLLLYGFWGERYGNHYANVGFLSSLWYMGGFALILLMGAGVISQMLIYRTQRVSDHKEGKNTGNNSVLSSLRLVGFLLSLGFVALIFAIGIASPLTSGLTEWMITYIPLWQGYREPQKWIGVLMLIEGILFMVGTLWFLKKFFHDRIVLSLGIGSIVLFFLIWSPGALMGYHGQLRTTVYPQEFEALRQTLIRESFSGRILVLPWHSYLGCRWTGRPTIANPIGGLMNPLPLVSADNIEVGDILYSNSQTEETKLVEEFLRDKTRDLLLQAQFTHILLMKNCASSDTYGWIESLCEVQYSGEDVDLYMCS